MSADQATETPEEKQTILQRLRANPLVPLIVGVAVAVALLAAIFFWAKGPDYATLYSGLTAADGGQIVTELDKMKVPYQLAANGTTILVPRAVVDGTRLKLASQGLPNSAGVGFELMDKQAFGISQFAEHVNFMRALQGELARSIETLDAVKSARVHLAIPKPSVFVRKQAKPSASVILELRRGRALSESQVNAIMHLVATSVTRLPLDNITVVDARGELLSEPGDNASGFSGNRLEYIARLESNYRQSIEDILAPVVGRDNIRAQVAVNVDFAQGQRTVESYTPNDGDAAVRSKQVNMSRQGGAKFIGGVPGSLTNRPAADVPSPIVAPDNPENAGNTDQNANSAQNQNAAAPQNGTAQNPANQTTTNATNTGTQAPSGSANRSATINYEVDRVIRHIKKDTGAVAQISAAVVINYTMQAVPVDPGEEANAGNEEGTDNASATQMKLRPLSDTRMQQIQSLVKQAIGFSASRGDSVSVVNVPFEESTEPTVSGPPWWQSPQLIAMAINALRWLLLIIVALILWFKVIKPLARRVPLLAGGPQLATAEGPAAAMAMADDEDEDGMSDAEANRRRKRRERHAQLLESTHEYAANDPKLVAMILKNWMHADG